MMEVPTPKRGIALVAGLALAAAGCAHVTPEQLNNRLTTLQQDMQAQMKAGNDSLSSRIDSLGGRVDGLQSELDSMRQSFNARIERIGSALRFDVPVHFAFNQDSLETDDEPVLQRFGQIVKQYYPEALVTVEGFADPAGSYAYNLRLGKRRAETVKSYLVSQSGLPSSQVRTVSYGAARNREVVPGAHGPGQQGWQNRRVVLVIDNAGGQTGASMGGGAGS